MIELKSHSSTLGASDKEAMLLLAVFFLFLYGFFFQGGGWSQNAVFDTVRALAEKTSLNIIEYAGNTKDISKFEGRIYANKTPGLAFFALPPYFIAYHLEHILGLDINSPIMINANAHLVTFFASAVPGVLLVILFYLYFRDKTLTAKQSIFGAGAFGLGSLVFPYSGILIRHNLEACLLFASWFVLSESATAKHSIAKRLTTLSGFLIGYAFFSDYLILPLTGLFLVFTWVKFRSFAHLLRFLLGPTIMLTLLFFQNYLCYGQFFVTNHTYQEALFTSEGFFLGVFGTPELSRLYWLTFHFHKGLFYCCPVFLLSFLGLLKFKRPILLTLDGVFSLLIIGYFLLFNLTFNSWSGGWGIGPRYLTPALPFLFLFAAKGIKAAPKISFALAVYSGVAMIAVTAVHALIPSNDRGPPPPVNPTAYAFTGLLNNQVSIATQSMLELLPSKADSAQESNYWDSYNLGEVVGLHGIVSLIPVLVAITLFVILALRITRHQE